MTCATCGAENRVEARFCDSCGSALAAAAPRAQRKTVTVLFCDVTGSTALGERLDPEALRAVMGRYFDVARAAIERHGGTLEKFIGDAVMAVFGVPTVREDDALRAVRAAQELRDGVEVDVRIGVNTGEVVTGSADSLVTGDAVNVAARLEQAASPGEVLLGASTYALVRDAVEVELLPPVEAKGKSEPLTAYRLVGVTGDVAVARRLDAPLVGRERERLLLAGAWQRSVSERAGVLFTILGTAGVGKSRLAAEFLAGLDATIVRGRCLSYGEGITYWPVVEVVKQLLGDAPPPDAAIAALLGDGVAAAEDVAVGVRKLLERAAAERPLAVVFDDIHWGEQTFLDLVEHVADWSRDAPILLLCLARPELLDVRPSWGGGKLNATTVLLEPLTRDETDELIDALLDGDRIDDGLRERIRSAADGNPLFVEQMLAMVEESTGEVTVPPTIQALLAARLDQLPPDERAALERGSVEGQVFHRGTVAALAPDEPNVAGRLLGLVRKELVRPSPATLPGDDAYRFRHLLIRDAAYDALPKAARAELHERFATWIEERAPDLVELDEIVGYHLERAALFRSELGSDATALAGRAAERLGAAGLRAARREDNPAAATLLRRALELLPRDDPRRPPLLPALAEATYWLGDFEGMEAAVAEAVAADDPDVVAQATFLRSFAHGHGSGSGHGLAELQADTEALIERLDGRLSDASLAIGYLTLARIAYWRGALGESVAAGERSFEHAGRAGRADLQRAAAGTIGIVLKWDTTPWPVAERRVAELLEATDADQLLDVLAHAAAAQGRFDEARAHLSEVTRREQERGARLSIATRSMVVAYIEFLAERYDLAEPVLRIGWDELGVLGEQGYRSTIGAMLGEALAFLGRLDEAQAFVDESEQITAPDDFISVAGVLRGRGAIALAAGDFAGAAARFRESIDIVGASEYTAYEVELWLLYARSLAAAGEEGARAAAERALELAEQKHFLVLADRARELLAVAHR